MTQNTKKGGNRHRITALFSILAACKQYSCNAYHSFNSFSMAAI